jgi:tetratricopeptide (TPR) repeat protein
MHRIAATAVAVALALSARTAAAQADADAERQRAALYNEGYALAQQGRWAEAVDRFQHVVAIRSAPRALFTLGQAEEKLGELATAERTFQRALTDARAAGEFAVVDAADQAIRELHPRVPHLFLRLDASAADRAPDAKATVDGEPVATGQLLDLDPGKHEVLVQAPGAQAFTRRLDLAPGTTNEIDVTLEPLASAPAPTATVAPAIVAQRDTRESTTRGPSRVGPLVLGSAGLAAGITGIVLRLTGQSDYDAASANCSGGACGSLSAANAGNDARSRVLAGTIVTIVGAAVIVAAGVWWILQSDGGRTTLAMRVSF